MRRLILLTLVAVGLAPGTWVRSPLPEYTTSQEISVTPLDAPSAESGDFELVGAWQIESRNADFGSYSAMILLDDGRMLVASDRGRILEFSVPGAEQSPSRMGWFRPGREVDKHLADIEAMTRDPDSGIIWTAYEGSNAIARLDPDTSAERQVFPAAMKGWSSNAGPEAMVRLDDGRFAVLSEALGGMLGREAPSVIFAGDPVDGAKAKRFTFKAPEGYRATDMTALPDGRVLVLVRKLVFGLPPGFATKLVLADPADIAEGEAWSGEEVVTLDDIAPSENYEAIAVEAGDDDSLTVWILSDDNNATLQRTLLLKLRYTPSSPE
ncbi:esterase-like activity of phytase family protein [Altererythrobacter sp. ZODW24]|uniref:esterase-like activity of phytase family protein n=1 Tax=Altererythrobacter sp. ZODW24 TaxID=2185142 RepID=UPI000DF7D41F|nr:esterase-like activity of phytase family protein [Altererythrobacter sp. ZODW24]